MHRDTRRRSIRRLGTVLVVSGLVGLIAPSVMTAAVAADADVPTGDVIVAEPAVTDPATPGDPLVTDPVPTDPATTGDPLVTDPAVTDPAVTDPAVPGDPVAVDPVADPSPVAAPAPSPAPDVVATEEPTPEPPEGVVITVNDMPMTGEEGGKIAGCTIEVGITGLPADPEPSTSIGVVIKAVPPMTPEGSPVTLVDATDTTSATTWSAAFPMDDLVTPFTPHGNGYRLKVFVSIDGTLAGASAYWLGCGEPQTGNPTRVQFLVQWQGVDGVVSTTAPLASLPAGWQDGFRLDATSKKGTAECTYAAGSAILECTYDNPGHGTEPGLVVPGNPEATYDVGVTGVPGGWDLDSATVGTFIGRETCPRGHDGEDGGEGEVTPAAEGEEGREPCFHTVVLVQQPLPVVTTVPSEVEAASVTSQPLAMTGRSSSLFIGVGGALLAGGVLMLLVAARLGRRTRTTG